MNGLYQLDRMAARSSLHHDSSLEGELPLGNITSGSIPEHHRPPIGRLLASMAPVPYSNEMRPVHTVARDTLFLLDRRLNEAEDDLLTWVRVYRIDTSGCTWLDLH